MNLRPSYPTYLDLQRSELNDLPGTAVHKAKLCATRPSKASEFQTIPHVVILSSGRLNSQGNASAATIQYHSVHVSVHPGKELLGREETQTDMGTFTVQPGTRAVAKATLGQEGNRGRECL